MARVLEQAPVSAEHGSPNYWLIWLYLSILTVIEIAVIFAPVARFLIVIALISLALAKATLVAAYFMHLRFEVRTLALIALTPLVLGALLIFILLPDHSAVLRTTAESVKVAPAAGHR
jgi:cytochrome c oxidase subunit 4